jgi:hypothetical protein
MPYHIRCVPLVVDMAYEAPALCVTACQRGPLRPTQSIMAALTSGNPGEQNIFAAEATHRCGMALGTLHFAMGGMAVHC